MPLSIYLHIPFCTVRCGYCDFNTYAGLDSLVPAYCGALSREIRRAAAHAANRAPDQVHTIYFGGGTPSLLPVEDVAEILNALKASFPVSQDAEVTLEANPGTVDLRKFEGLRAAGINRLSMGAQSGRPSELELLDRAHSPEDVETAVGAARCAGFDNIGLDLMYGLPRQSLRNWDDSLRWALAFEVEHLSLYALTLERGTPLKHRVERGELADPDPDLAADMYEIATMRLQESGYVQYEISNWARPGRTGEAMPASACRHNLQYWRNEPYLGLGAGAHGYAAGWRYSNVLSPRAYIERMESDRLSAPPCTPAAAERRHVERTEEMDDTMMLGFRLTSEGVDAGRFAGRFGEDPRRRYAERLGPLASAGLIEGVGEALRLTRRGRILGNQVFQSFV